ncbi:hypothetical protein D1007_05790 [Hordeum vulgare]|nr:hypothetical protein D1007_05790 [Hordeum vulgare]
MARPSHHELRFVTLITGELFSLSHPPANFYRLLISGDTVLAFIWTVSHIVQYCNLGDADVHVDDDNEHNDLDESYDESASQVVVDHDNKQNDVDNEQTDVIEFYAEGVSQEGVGGPIGHNDHHDDVEFELDIGYNDYQ